MAFPEASYCFLSRNVTPEYFEVDLKLQNLHEVVIGIAEVTLTARFRTQGAR